MGTDLEWEGHHVGLPAVEEDTPEGTDRVVVVHPSVLPWAEVRRIAREGTLPDLAVGWDHCVRR